jgi:hypothetical protein
MGYVHRSGEHHYPKDDKRCIAFTLHTYGFRSRDGKREISSETKHRIIAYAPWVSKVEHMLKQGGMVYLEAVLYALPDANGNRPEYSNGLMMQHMQVIQCQQPYLQPQEDSFAITRQERAPQAIPSKQTSSKQIPSQQAFSQENTPPRPMELPDEFPDIITLPF